MSAIVGIEKRNLNKILVTQDYPFTGLGTADKILLAVGQDIVLLAERGEIDIIPATDKWNSAERMVEDAQWVLDVAGMPPMSDDECADRVLRLKAKRDHLTSKAYEQRLLDREAEALARME